jgi:hypothetical protein
MNVSVTQTGRRFLHRTIALAVLAVFVIGGLPTSDSARAADKPNVKAKGKGKLDPEKREEKKLEKLKESVPAAPQRQITIAKVDASKTDFVQTAAARIDALVEANYKKHGVEANPALGDELFVRRIYLDITGTIPTLEQTRAAISKRSTPGWRAALIDQLLNTDGYASHQYNFWADILRLQDGRIMKSLTASPYNEWVRRSIETNMPYDKFVYEMLAASGKGLDNPATGYILRDANMPLDALNNTIRVFLGTQIGCAQCHDHPFDRWTQQEFYQMAAYTYPTTYGQNVPGQRKMFAEAREAIRKADGNTLKGGNAKYRTIIEGNILAVADGPAKLKYPEGIDGEGVKAGEVVKPHAIFDPPIKISSSETPRAAFARWVTSPQNPRFAKTIANRLWKHVYGVGQIEPVDNMMDETVAENPELMTALTNLVVNLKFDTKEYLRILYNTKTYQREATRAEVDVLAYHFPGPILRRMTAEQVWDSFVTLAAFDNPNAYHKPSSKGETNILSIDVAKTTGEELLKRLNDFQEYTSKKSQLARTADYVYKSLVLVRASELPTPLPPGHFLRQFGQSDRELIEGSNTDGSVPQALQMFNGPITHMLLEPDSLLAKNVLKESNQADQIDVIFLSVLSRRATSDDRRIATDEIRKYQKAGYGNIIWALVNTPEFLFIQ